MPGMRPNTPILTQNDLKLLKNVKAKTVEVLAKLQNAKELRQKALVLWERGSDHADYLYDRFTIADEFFDTTVNKLIKFVEKANQELSRF